MWGNIIAIHNVFFSRKKTTKLNYQSAQYEKNIKINKDNSGKKTKKKEKNHMEKYCSNQQCFKEKTAELNSQLAQY